MKMHVHKINGHGFGYRVKVGIGHSSIKSISVMGKCGCASAFIEATGDTVLLGQ